MQRLFPLLLLLVGTGAPVAAGEVLIVADEFPAMQALARHLQTDGRIASRLVAQTNLPAQLASFSAIIVYIHRDLEAGPERALVDYTRAGGKLIALHHSISSGKRKNKLWFPFLGVSLPEDDVDRGGYKWIEPVTLDFVNLAPDHFIMTNRVRYPRQIPYRRGEGTGEELTLPGFRLVDSEVYINHQLTRPRTVLMGFKYADAATGRLFMQDRAGWLMPADRGWIIYFQPGHSARDFEEPAYARILLNAVLWQPAAAGF